LAPVCGLHKVVAFELGYHVPVRVACAYVNELVRRESGQTHQSRKPRCGTNM
jgi:hypothetical protein